jgi:hypothetical protein
MSSSKRAKPDVQGAQRPRISLVPKAEVNETGEMALEVCALAGLHLDPWQQWVLTSSLGERADGKWAAFEVGMVVPRQNGKGSTLEGRELTGLFVIGEERLIIHSAHEQATSSEHQRRLLELIESVPEFDQKVVRAPKGKGMEAIELRDGSRILFKTRTGGGGRGFTGDLVVMDEAMILPTKTIGTLVPTMAARSKEGNPQLWYAGSAVDQDSMEHGVSLARVRERALNGTPRLMYVEWSIEGDDPSNVPRNIRNNPAAWAQANPGLGLRITAEHVGLEANGAMGPREFAVERLGVGDWPSTADDEHVIDPEVWAARMGSSAPGDELVIAFDVRPDRSSSSIAAAWKRDDGRGHLTLIDRRPGTGWLVDRLVDLKADRHPLAVICDRRSPAGALLTEFDNAGVDVEAVDVAEVVQACGVFFDLVDQDRMRHTYNEDLDAAVRGAAKRNLGDAWAWSRKSSGVDIAPLVAGTLALWKLQSVAASVYETRGPIFV